MRPPGASWEGVEGVGVGRWWGGGLTSAVCLGTTLLTSAVNSHVTLQAAAVGALWVSDGGETNAGYGDGSAAGCSGSGPLQGLRRPAARQPASTGYVSSSMLTVRGQRQVNKHPAI